MICPPCADGRHEACEDADRTLAGRRTGCTCQHGQAAAHTATSPAAETRQLRILLRQIATDLRSGTDPQLIADNITRVLEEPPR